MTAKNLLRISNLSYSFGVAEPLIEGLSLSICSGQRIALTGPNGCGKSTLLKIIEKQITGFSGALIQNCRVAFVSQEAAAEHLGLSGGESRRLSTERAFNANPDLLLLDEPTNDLDNDTKKKFFESLESFKGACVLVSHDPEVLDFVDEIWELKNGKLQRHPPGFKEYINRIMAEEEALTELIRGLEGKKRKREEAARLSIARQEKRSVRGQSAGVKSNLPKVIRGAKKRQAENTLAKVKEVHEKRVSQSNSTLKDSQRRLRQLSMFKWDSVITRPPSGKRLILAKNLMMRGFLKALCFELCGPKRVHLKGKNGSGKSTLLHALAGDKNALARTSGKLYLAHPFHLFDQKLAQFSSELSLWEWFQSRLQTPVHEARQILGRLGFEQTEQERPILGLSGGEKIRLELALALHKKESPQILLLDEPTNHLDVESRRILQVFLEKFEGALLVVSHDQRFIGSMAFDNRIDLDECL